MYSGCLSVTQIMSLGLSGAEAALVKLNVRPLPCLTSHIQLKLKCPEVCCMLCVCCMSTCCKALCSIFLVLLCHCCLHTIMKAFASHWRLVLSVKDMYLTSDRFSVMKATSEVTTSNYIVAHVCEKWRQEEHVIKSLHGVRFRTLIMLLWQQGALLVFV